MHVQGGNFRNMVLEKLASNHFDTEIKSYVAFA